METIIRQTVETAATTEEAALASAVARRMEIAADLATQDALIAYHQSRVDAFRAALTEPE